MAAASAAAAALEGGTAAAPACETGHGSGGHSGSGALSPLGAPRTPLASASSAQLTAQHRRKLEEQLEAAVRAEQDRVLVAGASGSAAAAAAAAAKEAARARLCERQREQAQALLLRWVEEQEGGAFEALAKAKSSLLSHKVRCRAARCFARVREGCCPDGGWVQQRPAGVWLAQAFVPCPGGPPASAAYPFPGGTPPWCAVPCRRSRASGSRSTRRRTCCCRPTIFCGACAPRRTTSSRRSAGGGWGSLGRSQRGCGMLAFRAWLVQKGQAAAFCYAWLRHHCRNHEQTSAVRLASARALRSHARHSHRGQCQLPSIPASLINWPSALPSPDFHPAAHFRQVQAEGPLRCARPPSPVLCGCRHVLHVSAATA